MPARLVPRSKRGRATLRREGHRVRRRLGASRLRARGRLETSLASPTRRARRRTTPLLRGRRGRNRAATATTRRPRPCTTSGADTGDPFRSPGEVDSKRRRANRQRGRSDRRPRRRRRSFLGNSGERNRRRRARRARRDDLDERRETREEVCNSLRARR